MNHLLVAYKLGRLPLADQKVYKNLEKSTNHQPTIVEEERRLMYLAVRVYVTLPNVVQEKPSKRSDFIGQLNLPIVKVEGF